MHAVVVTLTWIRAVSIGVHQLCSTEPSTADRRMPIALVLAPSKCRPEKRRAFRRSKRSAHSHHPRLPPQSRRGGTYFTVNSISLWQWVLQLSLKGVKTRWKFRCFMLHGSFTHYLNRRNAGQQSSHVRGVTVLWRMVSLVPWKHVRLIGALCDWDDQRPYDRG